LNHHFWKLKWGQWSFKDRSLYNFGDWKNQLFKKWPLRLSHWDQSESFRVIGILRKMKYAHKCRFYALVSKEFENPTTGMEKNIPESMFDGSLSNMHCLDQIK